MKLPKYPADDDRLCRYRSSYGVEEFEKYQDDLFQQQEDLYEAGARNFLFIDVPPIDKAPASSSLGIFG